MGASRIALAIQWSWRLLLVPMGRNGEKNCEATLLVSLTCVIRYLDIRVMYHLGSRNIELYRIKNELVDLKASVLCDKSLSTIQWSLFRSISHPYYDCIYKDKSSSQIIVPMQYWRSVPLLLIFTSTHPHTLKRGQTCQYTPTLTPTNLCTFLTFRTGGHGTYLRLKSLALDKLSVRGPNKRTQRLTPFKLQ